MSERTLTLAQRRNALRAHSAVQRAELAQTVDRIESRLGTVDHGLNIVRRYAAKPLLVTGGLALLVIIGPKRIFRWAGRGAVLLTAGQRIMRLLR